MTRFTVINHSESKVDAGLNIAENVKVKQPRKVLHRL